MDSSSILMKERCSMSKVRTTPKLRDEGWKDNATRCILHANARH